MTERVLLIDQGNTRVKWVLAMKGDIEKETAGQGNIAAFRQACQSGSLSGPDGVRLSSVAGSEHTQAIIDICGQTWSIGIQLLQSQQQQGGVINGYEAPATLGVDRWLAIVGAVSEYGKPVVIWDLGTAATLDAVDERGRHRGGMIYPGPATMLRSLDRDTRLRVPENLLPAGTVPGQTTSECIRSGVFAAQLGALNQFLRALGGAPGDTPRLVVTGGAAREILPLLDFEHVHDPWLVFRGMLVE